MHLEEILDRKNVDRRIANALISISQRNNITPIVEILLRTYPEYLQIYDNSKEMWNNPGSFYENNLRVNINGNKWSNFSLLSLSYSKASPIFMIKCLKEDALALKELAKSYIWDEEDEEMLRAEYDYNPSKVAGGFGDYLELDDGNRGVIGKINNIQFNLFDGKQNQKIEENYNKELIEKTLRYFEDNYAHWGNFFKEQMFDRHYLAFRQDINPLFGEKKLDSFLVYIAFEKMQISPDELSYLTTAPFIISKLGVMDSLLVFSVKNKNRLKKESVELLAQEFIKGYCNDPYINLNLLDNVHMNSSENNNSIDGRMKSKYKGPVNLFEYNSQKHKALSKIFLNSTLFDRKGKTSPRSDHDESWSFYNFLDKAKK